MAVLEFTANVKNGKIQIPPEYLDALNQVETIQITVISQPQTAAIGMIAELLKNPLEVEDFVPLTREEAHERE
jgi:hypothetical protein